MVFSCIRTFPARASHKGHHVTQVVQKKKDKRVSQGGSLFLSLASLILHLTSQCVNSPPAPITPCHTLWTLFLKCDVIYAGPLFRSANKQTRNKHTMSTTAFHHDIYRNDMTKCMIFIFYNYWRHIIRTLILLN